MLLKVTLNSAPTPICVGKPDRSFQKFSRRAEKVFSLAAGKTVEAMMIAVRQPATTAHLRVKIPES